MRVEITGDTQAETGKDTAGSWRRSSRRIHAGRKEEIKLIYRMQQREKVEEEK